MRTYVQKNTVGPDTEGVLWTIPTPPPAPPAPDVNPNPRGPIPGAISPEISAFIGPAGSVLQFVPLQLSLILLSSFILAQI